MVPIHIQTDCELYDRKGLSIASRVQHTMVFHFPRPLMAAEQNHPGGKCDPAIHLLVGKDGELVLF